MREREISWPDAWLGFIFGALATALMELADLAERGYIGFVLMLVGLGMFFIAASRAERNE